MRSKAWQDSNTISSALFPPSCALRTDLQSKAQASLRRLKTASVTTDHLWQVISLLICLPVSYTPHNVDLFSLPFFFLERKCAAAAAADTAANTSIQQQIKTYLPQSLPNVLFACSQTNPTAVSPWQIPIDPFRAIIRTNILQGRVICFDGTLHRI